MERRKLLAILRTFENAARDDELRGSQHPDDREYIHQRYKVIRERTIEKLLGNPAQ